MFSRANCGSRWPLWSVLALVLGGCVAPGVVDRPRPSTQTEFHLLPEHVPPLGLCRIWYTELPPQWQPPVLPCPRAHSLAAQHGGRVVKAISKKSFEDGRTLGMDYGPGRFADVPPEQLPPPGYCRAWHDRLPAERQPPSMTCAKAEQLVRQRGGRLLYMPGPEHQ